MQRAGSVSAPDSSVVLLPTPAAGCLAVDDPVPGSCAPLGAWNGEQASLITLQIDNSAQCVKTWILSAFNWASPWSTTTLQLSVQPFFIVALEKAGAGWLSGAAECCEKSGRTGSNGWVGSSGWCWTCGVVLCPLVMLLVYVLSVEVIQGSN